MKTRILEVLKRIAYHPTRAERLTMSDVILQQVSAMYQQDKYAMAVVKRRGKPGILLAYDAKQLVRFTDAQLRTILCHETQHLRSGDVTEAVASVWDADRDWYNGWTGKMLFNVARDCQINDELITNLGMTDVPKALKGTAMLGYDASKAPLEQVMRDFAAKYPPPESQDDAGGGAEHPEESEITEGEGEVEEVSIGQGDEPTKNPRRVVSSEEAARWQNFLATVLDTRKSQDSWNRQPKRLSGVPLYAKYEATLPRRQPLPRKTALIAIDVSGSMDEAGVQKICNLVRNAPANYDLTVLCFDTDSDVWENFRTNPEMPRRGGGTRFELVEAHCAAMMRYPDAILVLTDMGGTAPKVKRPNVWTWMGYNCGDACDYSEFPGKFVALEKVIKS